MTSSRRISERRRRVLYQNHVLPPKASTAASRERAERLREARQPASAFGSRVGRHLRGRWFSLVPVSRLAMAVLTVAVLSLSVGLAVLHHVSVTREEVAYHEAVVRVFRIDRPDSFAAWAQPLILLLGAGAAYLIYGLRSHSRDDYRGHYRLWRLMVMVLLAGSLQSVVGLIGWLGALIELLLGDRAVLSGANWFRIVVDVGGIILALRLVAETYRNRAALITYLLAGGLFGWYECVYWQVLELRTFVGATLWVATPLLTSTLILVATTAYLRELFRRARGIDQTISIREWIGERMPSLSNFRERDDVTDLQERLDAAMEDRIVPKHNTVRFSARPEPDSNRQNLPETHSQTQGLDSANESSKADGGQEPEQQGAEKPKRSGWFGRRKPKHDVGTETDTPGSDRDETELSEEIEKKRGGWFRRKPRADQAAESDDENDVVSQRDDEPPKRKRRFSFRLQPETPGDAESKNDDDSQAEPKEKKGWLSGLRRKPAPSESVEDEAQAHTNPARASDVADKVEPLSHSSDTDALEDEDDEIDWSSMSKAERRRMRRKRKRGGRAA